MWQWLGRPTSLAALVLAPLGAGCSLDVSYSESRYHCDQAEGCPTGYACSERGYCETMPSGRIDADVADGAREDAGQDPDGSIAPVDGGSPIDGAPRSDARVFDAAIPDASLPDARPPGPTTRDFVASRDTYLHGGNRSANFGGSSELICNGNPDMPVLIAWNLSSIPPGADVESAVLHLTTGANALQGESARMFALLEDWSEGNGNGSTGVASYDHRKNGTPWSTAGAKPPSRANESFLTFAPTAAGTEYDVPLPVSLVQGWVSQPGTNHGVVITCPFSNDVGFRARNDGSPPTLTITYQE